MKLNEARPEMFGDEDFLTLSEENFNRLKEEAYQKGLEDGDAATDMIISSVISAFAGAGMMEKNVDVEEEARKQGYDNFAEMVSDSEAFYEYTSDIGESYLLGLNQVWFRSILD